MSDTDYLYKIVRNAMKSEDKSSYWRNVILAWEQSTLSQPDFCKKHGVSYAQFGYWRSKLTKRKRNESNKFIPVQITSDVSTPVNSMLKLAIAPNVSLTITDDAQIHLAAKLLKALQ